MKILEFGHGLNPQNDATILLDINRHNLDRFKNSGRELIQWDLNNLPLPFEDNSTDKIYMFSVLEHLTVNTEEFLKEVLRILKPYSFFHIKVPNGYGLKWKLTYFIGKIPPIFTANGSDSIGHHKLFTYQSLYMLLHNVGFVIRFKENLNYFLPFSGFRDYVYFRVTKGAR